MNWRIGIAFGFRLITLIAAGSVRPARAPSLAGTPLGTARSAGFCDGPHRAWVFAAPDHAAGLPLQDKVSYTL